MSFQERIYTERNIARQEGIQEGELKERTRLEKKLSKKGMSEEEIKSILSY